MSATTPEFPALPELVAAMEDVLTGMLDVGRGLRPEQAGLPTECPGWTVQDQFSHVVGIEQVMMGAPLPEVVLPELAHVATDFDGFVEVMIHARRALPLVSVLDELAGMIPRRMAFLRERLAEGDPTMVGPMGPKPMSQVLPVRIFDMWAHEQDVRRAVGLPVRVHGVPATVALGRTVGAWVRLLPRIDGVHATLTIDVGGPAPRHEVVVIGDGGPALSLSGDLAELTRIGCGRAPAGDALTGPAELVASVAPHLAFTP